ncbi:TetR/AcrR family transcriptional regulator [Salininema proteolyticum]|uniref:TetR/AcrR family transcriptional regulator n=1 Tax=Salininema proteolyticum TaxID=1607685 RepID=A0ABV8TU31_9ACTN
MSEVPEVVWLRSRRGRRGPAPERDHAGITAAAVAIADEEGLEAVTMRSVARRLGTGPASLYRYVSSREDLLDLMTDEMAGEVDVSVPHTGDPAEDMADIALRIRAVYRAHPWFLDVPLEVLRMGPKGLRYLEYALGALEPTGAPGNAKLKTTAMTTGIVAMLVRMEREADPSNDSRFAAQARYIDSMISSGDFPLIAAAMGDQAADSRPVSDDEKLKETLRRVVRGLLGLPSPGRA